MEYKELYGLAVQAQKNAYAPYSKFNVGAALLTKDGKVFTGVNVENSSYGATICAERTAMCKAISEGARDFEAIAIVTSAGVGYPCGICRQFMWEFVDDDFKVVTGNDAEHLEVKTLKELLPEGFRLSEQDY